MGQAACAPGIHLPLLTQELWFGGLAGLCLNFLCSGLSPETLILASVHMAAMRSQNPAGHFTYIFSLIYLQGGCCYCCFMGQDTEGESCFLGISVLPGVSLLLGPTCSASVSLLLGPLAEVIPSNPLTPIPESLILLTETRLTPLSWTSAKQWTFTAIAVFCFGLIFNDNRSITKHKCLL